MKRLTSCFNCLKNGWRNYDRLGNTEGFISRLNRTNIRPNERGEFNADEVRKIGNILRHTIRQTHKKNENIKKKQKKSKKQKEKKEIKIKLQTETRRRKSTALGTTNQLQSQQRLTDTLAWVKDIYIVGLNPMDCTINIYQVTLMSTSIEIKMYTLERIF